MYMNAGPKERAMASPTVSPEMKGIITFKKRRKLGLSTEMAMEDDC